MKKLKLTYWLEKNRLLLWAIAVALVACIVIWCGIYINWRFIANDPALFGVAGTLLGAIIGGAISFWGSALVNRKQQSIAYNIKRKDTIYSPLYDELINIQNYILLQNPYPDYIVFEKDSQTYIPHPQYVAWGKIKLDSRYLETPKCLILQVEKLEESILKYLDVRHKVNTEIKEIMNQVLNENELEPLCASTIGNMISGGVLKNEVVDICEHELIILKGSNTDLAQKEKINQEIHKRCNENSLVQETRRCYEDWLKIQEQTIEMLSILIKKALLAYKV